MGEIADEMLERYLDGHWSDEDWDWDEPLLFRRGGTRAARCKNCGARVSFTLNGNGNWMPADGPGKGHICRATDKDFPPV